MHRYFETHRAMLDGALRAASQRTYWSAAPEAPSGKIYGETAKVDAEAAFKAQVGKPFEMEHPGSKRLGKEESPWGFPLGVTYPAASIDELVAASRAAGAGWAAAGIEARTGVCLEIIHRLNKQSFAIANAVQHTSGQPFVMAFQAGGPHAQDRALEAVAYAYGEMTKVPAKARWEKPQGGGQEPLRMDKQWRIVPRGIAVTIGCSTFPTWNSYPGMFASLATGNTVIVKPHPAAILPLAVTVRICRDVLKETGFDPNVVLLAVDEASAPITKELVTHPDVAIIDFTGSPAFGRWVRENAKGAQVYTEEAGVNSIVIELHAELQRHVRQHRLLAGPVLGPDVHCAARHLRAARRHQHGRGPQELRRCGARHRRRGGEADRQPRAGCRVAWHPPERGHRQPREDVVGEGQAATGLQVL